MYLNDRKYVTNAYDESLQVFRKRFSLNHKILQIQNSFGKKKKKTELLAHSVSITKDIRAQLHNYLDRFYKYKINENWS